MTVAAVIRSRFEHCARGGGPGRDPVVDLGLIAGNACELGRKLVVESVADHLRQHRFSEIFSRSPTSTSCAAVATAAFFDAGPDTGGRSARYG